MQTGDFLPIYAQLFDCANDKFPLARVYDDTGALIAGSPAALTLLANGLYRNRTSCVFPSNSEFLRVEVTVYDDAGHTVISPDQSAMCQIWKIGDGGFWYTDGVSMRVGDPTPLTAQSFDNSVDQFVRVFLRDENDAFLTESPVDLTPNALGLYSGVAPFPQSKYVTAQYVVYSDSGYTTISPDQAASMDMFMLGGAAPDLPSVAYSATAIVGVLDSDACEDNGLEDEIVKNSDRQVYVRLIRKDNGEPFDLSNFTDIEVRMKQADDTTLSVKYSDPGNPITILSLAIGKFVVSLTAAQTALLLAQNPAPFSIVVTMSGGAKTAINFPYQLAVFEELP